MSVVEERVSQLQTIKKIKERSKEFANISSTLSDAVGFFLKETIHINEYESELELLMQEKSYYLEQLRLIEQDVACIERTILEANIDKMRTLKVAHKLYNDYTNALVEVNSLRNSLGLLSLEDKRLPEAVELIKPNPAPSDVPPPPAVSTPTNNLSREPLEVSTGAPGGPPVFLEDTKPPPPLPGDPISHWLSSFRDFNWSRQQHQHVEIGDQNRSPHKDSLRVPERDLPPVGPLGLLRNPQSHQHHQQPPLQQPPMKTCQACQQLIHRNAPICPLCKTKSRSRHLKRPKGNKNRPPPVVTAGAAAVASSEAQ